MQFRGGSDTRQEAKTSCMGAAWAWHRSDLWSVQCSGWWWGWGGEGRRGLCQTLWHKLLMSSFYICDLHGHAPHLSHKWNLLERNCIKVAIVVVVVAAVTVVVAATCKLFTRLDPLQWHCLLRRKVLVKAATLQSLPPTPLSGSMMSSKQKLRNKINKYAWAQKLLNWKCALNISAFCNSHFPVLPVRHLVRHCTWLTANCTCAHLSPSSLAFGTRRK